LQHVVDSEDSDEELRSVAAEAINKITCALRSNPVRK
jgi:hypothetical protein